jgi:hypothetical protein
MTHPCFVCAEPHPRFAELDKLIAAEDAGRPTAIERRRFIMRPGGIQRMLMRAQRRREAVIAQQERRARYLAETGRTETRAA